MMADLVTWVYFLSEIKRIEPEIHNKVKIEALIIFKFRVKLGIP